MLPEWAVPLVEAKSGLDPRRPMRHSKWKGVCALLHEVSVSVDREFTDIECGEVGIRAHPQFFFAITSSLEMLLKLEKQRTKMASRRAQIQESSVWPADGDSVLFWWSRSHWATHLLAWVFQLIESP